MTIFRDGNMSLGWSSTDQQWRGKIAIYSPSAITTFLRLSAIRKHIAQ